MRPQLAIALLLGGFLAAAGCAVFREGSVVHGSARAVCADDPRAPTSPVVARTSAVLFCIQSP